jgi:uncharacterized protein (TIGR03437 family)
LLEHHGFRIQVDSRTPETLYGMSLPQSVSSQRREPALHARQTFLRNLSGEKQVAPGSLVSIYGQDIAGETATAASTPLPVSLGGASVLFDGHPAPLLFVSPGQINAQVPFGLAGPVMMEVRRADASVDRQTVHLSPRAVFVMRKNLTRESAPLLFHSSGFRPVSADEPARPGQAMTIFVLGMGDLEPSIAAGALPPTPPPLLADAPCVAFSGQPSSHGKVLAPLLWAGAAPGLIGVYQMNFEVPASLSPGLHTIHLVNWLNGPGSECPIGSSHFALDSFTIEVQ